MAIGIVNDEDFEAELEKLSSGKKSNSEPNAVVLDKESPGRKPGDNNVPDIVRELIAEERTLGLTRKEAAEIFGVSPQSTDAYKNGATSLATYNESKKDLFDVVLKTRQKV